MDENGIDSDVAFYILCGVIDLPIGKLIREKASGGKIKSDIPVVSVVFSIVLKLATPLIGTINQW
jgi:hypothetical protein